jgi:hypothetical protein
MASINFRISSLPANPGIQTVRTSADQRPWLEAPMLERNQLASQKLRVS